MKLTLLMLICAGLLCAVPPARAQTPLPPVAVPTTVEVMPDDAARKADLDQRRAVLLDHYQKWKTRADAFNQKFAGHEFDPDSQDAKDGVVENEWLTREARDYLIAAKTFQADVSKLRLQKTAVRGIINGINALAKKMGWSAEKQVRLNTALHQLSFDGNPDVTGGQIRDTWHKVILRGHDPELVREAGQGDGLGFPGAGKQSFNDCAVFALANATGRPYGVVASQATEIISQGAWHSENDQKHPQATIEQQGLRGGEMVMLAESFGQAEVVAGSDFARTLKAGRSIMVNVVPSDGDVNSGHEIVLTRTFQHGGETWYEMMDSNQNPDRRRFLSAKELSIMQQENGVAYRPEPGTTPQLLR